MEGITERKKIETIESKNSKDKRKFQGGYSY